ncbi:alpha-L-fucosidase [Agaribacter flavus]|uniref:alpha-L-fucosidase n=1 Tax=Agaribacter flavus TaxID=1902781 RepID=A0ABV7FQJ4_9ALTE
MLNKPILRQTILTMGALCALVACNKAPDEAKQGTNNKSTLAEQSEQKLDQIKKVANAGPYSPTWESFTNYQIPSWYHDAKFGIFIHWGVYSVPAHNGEWYPRKMYMQNNAEFQYHRDKYGPQDEFGYKDFIPQFTAEKFNADEWLKIVKNAGAKYIVPVAEHHDGFSMYDNSYTRWDAVEMGPKRDIIAELKRAAEKADIYFGLSSHRAENWWFFEGGREFASDVQNEAYRDLYGPAVSRKSSEAGETPPSKEFMDDWLLRTVEIVDKYQPDLIWFDWWMASEPFHHHVKLFTSYYYNKGINWERMPALNYKDLGDFRSFKPGSAVLDIERGQMSDTYEYFWQTDTSVSKTSWGYVTNHKYRDANSLVDDLIDIVSKNGSMLLNIGPKPDGTIPQPEIDLLYEIGAWLRINGEAIYNTRPWITFGEGPTEVLDGTHSNDGEKHRKDFNEKDIRFTQNKNALYAILMAWPGDNKTVTIRTINSENYDDAISTVTLLGHDTPLDFEQKPEGLAVKLPEHSPSEHAQVLKISK